MDFIKWIEQGLSRPGKSKSGLARALGIDPAGVTRLLKGDRRLQAGEIEKARRYFEDGEQAHLPGVPAPVAPNVAPAPDVPPFPAMTTLPKDLPVYGAAVGGAEGDFQLNGELVDLVRRPPGLMGNRGAFAIYVQGDSMAPWKRAGALIYLDPNRPARPQDYVVVECHGGDGEPGPAYLKMLVALTPTQVRLAQHNPPDDKIMLARKRVKRIYRVLEPEEFMGV